jgi:hypothetical protein
MDMAVESAAEEEAIAEEEQYILELASSNEFCRKGEEENLVSGDDETLPKAMLDEAKHLGGAPSDHLQSQFWLLVRGILPKLAQKANTENGHDGR